MYPFSCDDIFDAIQFNNLLDVEKFIKQGQIENKNDLKQTPLMFVLSKKKYDTVNIYDVVSMLVNNGCDVNCQDNEENTPLHSIIESIFQSNGLDRRGVDYICNDEFNILELLLKKGADVNKKNYGNRTPLFYINSNLPYLGSVDPINLEDHIDPGVMDLIGKPFGLVTLLDGPLGSKAKKMLEKNREWIEKLDEELEKEIIESRKKRTPEYLKEQENLRNSTNRHIYINSINRLIEDGAYLDIRDAAGKTIFHYAASHRTSNVIEHLLNCTSIATNCNFKRSEWFLTHNTEKEDSFHELYIKPEINRKDKDRKTPLRYAVEFRNILAEKIILKNLFDDSIVEKLEELNFFKRGKDVPDSIEILIDNDYKEIRDLYLDDYGNSIIKLRPWGIDLD